MVADSSRPASTDKSTGALERPPGPDPSRPMMSVVLWDGPLGQDFDGAIEIDVVGASKR